MAKNLALWTAVTAASMWVASCSGKADGSGSNSDTLEGGGSYAAPSATPTVDAPENPAATSSSNSVENLAPANGTAGSSSSAAPGVGSAIGANGPDKR